MSYELFVTAEFSAAHNLRNYKGKCERLHGHNWRVDLRLQGRRLNRTGLLLDFVEAKRILAAVLDRFDHAYLNEVPPMDRLNPSSENLARFIAGETAKRLPRGIRVASVTCWESAGCAATYKQTKVQSSKFKVQS